MKNTNKKKQIMGNCSTKNEVAVTPVQANIELKNRENNDLTMDPNVLMDPRSPDIHRTPLTDILGNRLNYRDRVELLPHTPINSLRSKLFNCSLNDKKFLDPRSPSQFIPRTPLNLSFDDTSKLNDNTALYSIEYNGYIEDESCRNFYERLANITFDDADNEAAANATKSQKVALHEIREEDQSDEVKSISEQEIQKLLVTASETMMQQPKTPVSKLPIVSKLKFTDDLEADGKCISPIVNNAVSINKTIAASSTFSSTPIVANNGQLKKILLKTHLKKVNKTEIFEDDEIDGCVMDTILDGNRSEDEILSTPAKRLNRDGGNTPRTPLSVLNRRSKSVETLSQRQSKLNQTKGNERVNNLRSELNDENIYFTPQPKSKGLRQRNAAICPRVAIFND